MANFFKHIWFVSALQRYKASCQMNFPPSGTQWHMVQLSGDTAEANAHEEWNRTFRNLRASHPKLDDTLKRIGSLHAQQLLWKQNTMTEKEIVLKEVEKAAVEKEKKLHLVTCQHEDEREIHRRELAAAVVDLLRSKGLMTSRGVTERILQLIAMERKRTGATYSEICRSLSWTNDGRWEHRLRNAYSATIKKHPQAPELPTLMQQLCTELSKEIHGLPWHGMAVRVDVALLHEDHVELIRQIVQHLGLEVEAYKQTL